MPADPTAPVVGEAVTYKARGGYDVIAVTERSIRLPEAGEVRIKVAAAAVNPTDILLRDPGLGNLPPPLTPGMDAAGIIEAVGSGVTRLAVSDEVMAAVTPMRPEGGAQAAYIVVPAASTVHKPNRTTLVEAATLPMNGLTALYALDIASLAPGQTFAVSGGAGWLAYQAIVIAKRQGLRVIADAKVAEFELVRGYGADVVVERGPGFADAIRREVPDGVDALLDTALLAEKSFPAIRDGGTYIPVRGWGDKPSERGIRIKPVLVNEVLARTDWLDALRELVESGHLMPRIAAEYTPHQVADAQRSLMAGGVRGRSVIVF
jgi:NADPH:quinone reductase-like Zn-dependent oxidoreductase